jgi:hypothetical protein
MFESRNINRRNINRTLAIATATFAGAWLTVATPAAVAAPPQAEATATPNPCPAGMDGLAADMRARGFSAQAANNAAQLTYRECLRAHAPTSPEPPVQGGSATKIRCGGS